MAMHESIGAPSGIPALAVVVASYLFPGIVALWVVADAQHRSRPLPYDYGMFVFFAWWALVPIYLFSTRSWRGFIPLGWFILICLAASLFGSVSAWLPVPGS
jgi:hypothetical protein